MYKLLTYLQGLWAEAAAASEARSTETDVSHPVSSTSESFASDPSHVIFQHCKPGQLQSATVQLINRTGQAQRMHVLPASNPAFRFVLSEKRGAVAPGLAQAVQVDFRPYEAKPYVTSLYVQCPVRAPRSGHSSACQSC